MSTQQTKTQRFHEMHRPGTPFVLFNIWDAGSAKAVADAGAPALATGSWSVAAAHGFGDGERLPLDLALANVERITQATHLPVSFDIESGYGDDAAAVGQTLARAIAAGAIGCNIEDSFPATGALREVADQIERLRHARSAADAALDRFFINARTDVFFQTPPPQHDDRMLVHTIERARAYAEAGADGLFAPGLADPALIAKLVAASPLPVNVMVGNGSPDWRTLANAGVARISHGPGPYLAAMNALRDAAQAALRIS